MARPATLPTTMPAIAPAPSFNPSFAGLPEAVYTRKDFKLQ